MRPPHKEGYAVSYSTYVNHKCRCEGCTADHLAKFNAYRKRAPAEVKARINRRKTRRTKRQNDAIRKSSPRLGAKWTPEDLAVATDPSITAREAASILGRTIYAVKQKRSQDRQNR